jgi:hypothetical protein
MRIKIDIHDDPIRRVAELTAIREITSRVRLGLEALVARESG